MRRYPRDAPLFSRRFGLSGDENEETGGCSFTREGRGECESDEWGPFELKEAVGEMHKGYGAGEREGEGARKREIGATPLF